MRRTCFIAILTYVSLSMSIIIPTTQAPWTTPGFDQTNKRSASVSEAFPSDMPLVYVDPQNVSVSPGEVFTIAVKIFNLSDNYYATDVEWEPGAPLPPPGTAYNYSLGNLYGLDTRLNWDTTILEYLNHTVTIPVEDYPGGILHKPVVSVMDEVNTGVGRFWLAQASIQPAPSFNLPNDSATVFIMTFKAKTAGGCSLYFSYTALANPHIMPHTTRGGYIESVPSEHDVGVLMDAPTHVTPGASVFLQITVLNVGSSIIADTECVVSIDSSMVDSHVIDVLEVNSSYTFTHLWTPTIEAFHNLTARVSQVMDETNLMNNVCTVDVLVSDVIKVPFHFTSINEAIDKASPRATISVDPGIYYEILVIDKPLTILGAGKSTIVDGHGNDCIVRITSEEATFTGFTVRNGYRLGFQLWKTSNIVVSNNFISNVEYGVDLWETNNSIVRSNIISNTETGVLLGRSSYNRIVNNLVINASNIGMEISNSENNTIIRNRLVSNTLAMSLTETWNNQIYYNNFLDNSTELSRTESYDIWHNDNNEGNYWSDYEGADLNGDGIGDTLLPHKGVDFHPLMEPWTPIPGDVNIDNVVDIMDVVIMAALYNCREEDPNWIPEADLAPSWGIIDLFDIVTCIYHYGKTQP